MHGRFQLASCFDRHVVPVAERPEFVFSFQLVQLSRVERRAIGSGFGHLLVLRMVTGGSWRNGTGNELSDEFLWRIFLKDSAVRRLLPLGRIYKEYLCDMEFFEHYLQDNGLDRHAQPRKT